MPALQFELSIILMVVLGVLPVPVPVPVQVVVERHDDADADAEYLLGFVVVGVVTTAISKPMDG